MSTVKKLLTHLISETDEIKKTLSPNVVSKAKSFDSLNENIKKLSGIVKVKNVFVSFDEKGQVIKLKCEIDPGEIRIGDDSSVDCSDVFPVLNELGLISSEDQSTIAEAVEKAKRENKS